MRRWTTLTVMAMLASVGCGVAMDDPITIAHTARPCTLPDGTSLAHGQSVTGYAHASVPDAGSIAASAAACGARGTLTCTDGTLTGSGGPYPSCTFPIDQVCPGPTPAYTWFRAHRRCGTAAGQAFWNMQATTGATLTDFDRVWDADCMAYPPGDDVACNNGVLCDGATYNEYTATCTAF